MFPFKKYCFLKEIQQGDTDRTGRKYVIGFLTFDLG